MKKKAPAHLKMFRDRAADAAGFLQGMLDWPGVSIEIGLDRYGGVRVQRVWSPDGHEGLGWGRSDRNPRSLALLLGVEEFLITNGSEKAKDVLVDILVQLGP